MYIHICKTRPHNELCGNHMIMTNNLLAPLEQVVPPFSIKSGVRHLSQSCVVVQCQLGLVPQVSGV